MYDMGNHPSISLFTFQEDGKEIISMAEIHEGISGSVQDVGDCGLPNPYDGLVMDGWSLPNI
jgi:hypothetical protein